MTNEKKYIKTSTIADAISEAIKNSNSFRFVAGGTDIFPNKFQENDTSDCFIDIADIEELKQITYTKDYLNIGALTTLETLKNNEFIAQNFPTLIEAANSVASPVIRKSATLGGNLLCENRCHFYNQSAWWRQAAGHCLKCGGDICLANGGKKYCFSKFVSDTAIALISFNAKIEIVSPEKTEFLYLEEIYSGDGIQHLLLEKSSIIKSIQIPLNIIYKSVFKKLRQRKSLEFSSLTTCITVFKDNKIKIVAGAIAPKPIFVVGALKDDFSELITSIAKNSKIVENDSYSRVYRKNMIRVLLNRSIKEIQLTEK